MSSLVFIFFFHLISFDLIDMDSFALDKYFDFDLNLIRLDFICILIRLHYIRFDYSFSFNSI